MTWLQKYDDIIQFRKEHPVDESMYSEVHHIRPKCLFPELAKDSSNLISLTASEHFKAHYYLWKHYSEDTDDKNAAIKMHAAIMLMHKQVVDKMSSEEVEAAAKIFEEARIEQAKISRNRLKGIPLSDEVKKKISERRKGISLPLQARQKLSIAKRGNKCALGHVMTDKSKKTMRDKLSKKLSGSKNPAFGRHWYNNGTINVYVKDTECPEGFVKGLLRRKADFSGKNNPMYGKSSWAKCTPEQRAERVAKMKATISRKKTARTK